MRQKRAYHNLRYRSDPEYRARKIAANKAWNEISKLDPIQDRLNRLSKKIYDLRDAMENHQRKAEDYERRLMRAVRERERLRKVRPDRRRKPAAAQEKAA